MATKKYESMRIMSLEGSVVFKNDGFTATKDGKPDSKAFRGVLDESLDTLKLLRCTIGTKASLLTLISTARSDSAAPLCAFPSTVRSSCMNPTATATF